MRINPEDTFAVMIDIQYRLFPHIYDFEQLELNSARLIEGMHILDIPIIMTEQYPKGLGPTIPSLKEMLGREISPIVKDTFSCCGEGGFMEAVEKHDRKNVIIFGIEAHVCVLQTVTDLIEGGYQPVVIANCVSSREKLDRDFAIERMRDEGAIITTFESILFELCVTSKHEKFKQISNLVK
ncbi:MAG: hydrolase [Candidatus Kapaibacterium sp.]